MSALSRGVRGSRSPLLRFAVDERSGRRESFSVAGWSLELAEPRVEAEYVAAVNQAGGALLGSPLGRAAPDLVARMRSAPARRRIATLTGMP